jgi:hypothetical protein
MPVMGWVDVADDALSDCFSCQYMEYHLIFYFSQSVSQANIVKMNAVPLLQQLA